METDKETKEKLLESAKAEFMKRGYAKASLRKICANAGVTTGALYFFFKDKEDLFSSIVDPPLRELMNMMKAHFNEDSKLLSSEDSYEQTDGDHNELVHQLIHHLYSNRDTFLLLLTKSQGTSYENCIDEIVELMEQDYRVMAENLSKQTKETKVNSYMIHWLTHMNIDAFIHLLTHEPDEQKAMCHMQMIMNYLVKGWMDMVLISENDDKK